MFQETQWDRVLKGRTGWLPRPAVFFAVTITSILLTAAQLTAADPPQEEKRIRESIDVLQSLTATPDDAIPEYILDRAEAVVVIPSLIKGGFVVGAEHGTGVMSVQDQETNQWSPPHFVKMTGGTFGWQIGVQAIDLVLVVMNTDGVEDLLTSEFTLGADASVAAGPVGRSAEASTDATMGAKILAYSRAKGLFAGATIEGASLRTDDDANRRFYGRDVSTARLVAKRPPMPIPAAGERWIAALDRIVDPAT